MDSWRGFGMSNGAFEENPDVAPGQGYWLATARPMPRVELTGYTPADPMEVSLTPGWNLLGVPRLDEPFSFSDVRIRDGLNTYSWGAEGSETRVAPWVKWYADNAPDLVNNGQYKTSYPESWMSSDNPWGGYYVWAHLPVTLVFPSRALPRLPASGPLVSKTTRSREETGTWTLVFSVQSGPSGDGGILVGTKSGCLEGYDLWDEFKPPLPGGGVRLAVVQTGAPWSEFQAAYGPPGSDRLQWTLRVTGDGANATLAWHGVEDLPPGLHAYVIDPSSALATDLSLRSNWSVTSSPGGSDLQILVTSQELPEADLAPTHTGIRRLSPNPTSGPVDLDYELADTGPLRVTVFDAAGRQVATVLNELRPAGRHQVRWDPSGYVAGESRRSSGVLFLKFEVRGVSETRKIVVVR
jgi:hypothetical protein